MALSHDVWCTLQSGAGNRFQRTGDDLVKVMLYVNRQWLGLVVGEDCINAFFRSLAQCLAAVCGPTRFKSNARVDRNNPAQNFQVFGVKDP